MSRSANRLALAVAISLVSQQQLRAQFAAQAEEKYAIRTYEVGDLIINVPDYASPSGSEASGVGSGMGRAGGGGGFFSVPDDADFGAVGSPIGSAPIILTQMGGGGGYGGGGRMGGGGGGMGGMGGGMVTVPDSPGRGNSDSLQIDFDSLIDAITSVCSPNSWTVNGGGEGDIHVVGAALVVRQTNAIHNEISDLLDQLRAGSARRQTVTIDARWLQLNSDELDQLLSGEDGKINREALKTFTRRPTSLRAMTNCFSGQGIYIISGTRRNVVSGYIPVVGSLSSPQPDVALVSLSSDATITYLQDQQTAPFVEAGPRVGYQPLVERPNIGAKLNIRPTVMQGEPAAVVDLVSTITFPGAGASDAAEEGPGRPRGGRGAIVPGVDRAAIDAQELATTLRVPLGEPTLVGGMSYLGAAADAAAVDAANVQPAGGEAPQLYLVLEVR